MTFKQTNWQSHLEVGILLYHDYEKKLPSNYGSEMMTEKNKR